MKTIFTNSEITHVFAQQTQNEGRTSNNGMFFYGKKIYSYGYHYLLAEFIDDNTIVINNSGYSVSTSKHINLVTNATRQYNQYFYLDIDLKNVTYQIKNASEKIIKARKKEVYANIIISKFESLTDFLKKYKKVNDLKSNEYKEIKKIYNAISKDKDKYIQLAQERTKKEQEREKKKFNEALTKFFNYELNYISTKTNEDFLRISQDGTQIETTQGVKIDIQEAKILYKMIQEGKDIKGLRISNYTIISINGTLKIGCHKINIKNVHQIGKQIINF